MQKKLLTGIWICLGWICTTSFALAQVSGSVVGQLKDQESGDWLEFVSVGVKAPGKEGYVAGATSNLEGRFTISNLAAGNYQLEIFFVGYEKKVIEEVVISPTKPRIDVGTIVMSAAVTKLDEVIVQGERNFVQATIDGLEVKPSANLSSEGGSALDVLRNTPSVNVSFDGGVSLRGTGSTNILINGRNSALAGNLEQIPASAIASIEIVTNPGAKYDAQGQGGVINIKLKEEKPIGTKGSLQLGAGTNNSYNFAAEISHSAKKFTVFTDYSWRRWFRISDSEMERYTKAEREATRLLQIGNDEMIGNSHNFKAGFEYQLSPKTKINADALVNYFGSDRDELVLNTQVPNNSQNIYLRRTNEQYMGRLNLEGNWGLKHEFAKGKDLNASFTYSSGRGGVDRNMESFFGEASQNTRQFTQSEGINRLLVGQLDYNHDLGAVGKLETGFKLTSRVEDEDFIFENFNFANNLFENDPLKTNHFRYEENVYAAYALLKGQAGKWEYSAGLRVEATDLNTLLYNTGETNNRNFANLFPSFKTLYHLTENQSVKFTYSRRIDRPGSWHLNPFPDLADSLNIRTGNPNLMPEYINSFELGHSVDFRKASLTTNLFYRQVNGVIDWITRIEEGIAYRRPENLNDGVSYGVELIGQASLTPWWKMNASYTVFVNKVDGTNLNANFSNTQVGSNAKMVSDFELSKGLAFQLTGNYTAPEAEAQGFEAEQYFVDMGMRKSLWNKKASLSLNFRDVFNTLRRIDIVDTDTFYQNRYRKDLTRMLIVNLRYKI